MITVTEEVQAVSLESSVESGTDVGVDEV